MPRFIGRELQRLIARATVHATDSLEQDEAADEVINRMEEFITQHNSQPATAFRTMVEKELECDPH